MSTNERNCRCKEGWDIRCCCYPPMINKYFPLTFKADDLGWYKKEGHEDNWDNCPMKVPNAVWHYKNSRICNKFTKKETYHMPYAKCVFGIMRLSQSEVKNAIQLLKEEDTE